jgi:tRNA-2-methylthio-N6-dimethylallyladenosine synthase
MQQNTEIGLFAKPSIVEHMTGKLFHITTMGCQMNVYDSEQMERLLAAMDMQPTSDPTRADVIVVNTCCIREKPEHKVYSHLGRLLSLKRKKPGLIIAVGGCVAQQEGRRLLKRAPHVDIVFGTSAIGRLPGLIRRRKEEGVRLVDVDGTSADAFEVIPAEFQQGRATAFVTVMTGCDNYCTYCVVPYVRGREVSRRPERILEEIERLVDTGAREVTLLGQNVNSYGLKNGFGIDFSGLLEWVNKVDGLKRIRFTTSHPKDLSDRLIKAFGDLEKLAPHIHLPVQSGSDGILKRMNRRYTRESYLKKITALRQVRQDLAITSDLIVGFPGEERADFEETVALVEAVAFDNIYAFKYSDRRDVASASFPDKVDETEKKERLARLLEVQSAITLKKNKCLEGTIQEVLVEGLSKTGDAQMTGHTPCNKTVNFSNFSQKGVGVGDVVRVHIVEGLSHSLLGMPENSWEERFGKKGGILHAA